MIERVPGHLYWEQHGEVPGCWEQLQGWRTCWLPWVAWPPRVTWTPSIPWICPDLGVPGLVPGVPGFDPIRLDICTSYTLHCVNATTKLGRKVKCRRGQAIDPDTASHKNAKNPSEVSNYVYEALTLQRVYSLPHFNASVNARDKSTWGDVMDVRETATGGDLTTLTSHMRSECDLRSMDSLGMEEIYSRL